MVKGKDKVSEAVIRRLPVYHRFLTEITEKNVDRISSSELSKLTGFTASQIRQDLNNFGGFGQQGYGYNTVELKEEIGNILGMHHHHDTILIGAGRLGSAIARYNGFKESGFAIKALFDYDEKKIGDNVDGIKIYSMDELEKFIKDKHIEVAIVTVPKQSAKEVIERAIDSGVIGIWNFAPIDITVPNNVVIENIRLNDSLLKLSYYLKERI